MDEEEIEKMKNENSRLKAVLGETVCSFSLRRTFLTKFSPPKLRIS